MSNGVVDDMVGTVGKTSRSMDDTNWKPMQVAIFGLGRAGQIHIENLAIGFRVNVKYMVDLEFDKLKHFQRKYRLFSAELLLAKEADKVFKDSEVRAVIICSTTTTHGPLIRQAIEAGKSIFCEKPIAESLEEIISCYQLARAKNCILHCSFNRRFDPSLVNARSRMRDEVGTVCVVKTTARDSPFPSMEFLRVSGGFFHDCAVHDLDLVCWLLGEWPATVFVMGHAVDERIKEMDDVDVANIMLHFPSGTIAHIDLCRHSAVGYDQRLEVAGTKGMLQVENSASNKVATFNDRGSHHSRFEHSFPQRYRESYQISMKHFFDMIEDGEKPKVDALSSINVTKLAIVCEESYRLGKPMPFEPITAI